MLNSSPSTHFNLNSPTDCITVQGQTFYVKRDDLLHPIFNGNKARKFLYYLYLKDTQIKTIISFGGNQSNAMLALSVLARIKHWRFDYYLKKLPQQLRNNPSGNFKYACEHGMSYHEVTEFPIIHPTPESIILKQGGVGAEAEFGIATLANEINQWVMNQQIDDACIFVPSGTGTTAFYLQQHTQLSVYTTPCVGDSEYLKKQWHHLNIDTPRYPIIIPFDQHARFGQPYLPYFEIWQRLLEETGIEFDLLYDPVGWISILKHRHCLAKNIIYIHCGGVNGNESMVDRYNYRFTKSVIMKHSEKCLDE
ncbi:MAG TPA: 1-aminocyclopropane-1-carboxylate deaminase/D-cysteine desulfhydrase [Crenotrichaceae bacterium]|nr:1-aminocyclopropane-1-carboxylate deaminase/D-cysteine desulfhydrase [Crenotrichaceae bacterium]